MQFLKKMDWDKVSIHHIDSIYAKLFYPYSHLPGVHDYAVMSEENRIKHLNEMAVLMQKNCII